MLNYRIFVITFFSFITRFTALFLLGRHIAPETWEYDDIALNIIQKKEYAYEHLNTIYHSYVYPVYPAICAIFHFLTRYNYFIIEIFQIMLSSLTCLFIFLIGKKIYNEKVGLTSAFLVVLHPGLIVYSTKIHELTLVIFFIVTVFWLFLYLDYSKFYNNFLIGSLIGLGILTRPTLIFLIPVYALYLCLSFSRRKTIFKALVLVSLTAFLLILPWTIRNYGVHKRWIFITTSSAEQFWVGNNSWASGSALTREGGDILSKVPERFKERLYKMNEMQQYDFFYNEAMKFIKSNPQIFLKMFIKKLIYFWWFSPQTGKLYPSIWTVIYKVYYSIFFIFFILGCRFSFESAFKINQPAALSLFLLFILVSALHSIYYVELRHRWSIEPLMCLVAAFGLVYIIEKIRSKIENWSFFREHKFE